jgi:hypothetical protein
VKHGRIDCSGVKRESADDLLKPVRLPGIHGHVVVNFGHFDFDPILWGCPLGRRVTVLFWGCVLVLVEGSDYVTRHRQVDSALLVVPIEADTTVELAFPVAHSFVVFLKSVV